MRLGVALWGFLVGAAEGGAAGKGPFKFDAGYPCHPSALRTRACLHQAGIDFASLSRKRRSDLSQEQARDDSADSSSFARPGSRHDSESSSDGSASGYHDFRPRSVDELLDANGNWSFEWKVMSAETFRSLFAGVSEKAFAGRKLILQGLQLKDQELMLALPRSIRVIRLVDPLVDLRDLQNLEHLWDLEELELQSGDVIYGDQLQRWFDSLRVQELTAGSSGLDCESCN